MRSVYVSVLLLAACGDDGAHSHDGPIDGTVTLDSPAGSSTCGRVLAADGPRHVVISRPYDTNGDAATKFEVLSLSATGVLARGATPVTFDMHRTNFGTIAFTPDGKIGLVAQEDGSLGVFALAADGTPSVVTASFGSATFYADRVIVDPSGDFAYILDGNTRANGGGIYAIRIGCDGTPTSLGLIAAGSTPGGLILDGDRALVAAGSLLDSATGADAELLHWMGTDLPTVTAGADAFGDDDAIVGGAALTSDKHTFLIGDKNSFSTTGNRVAVVTVGDTTLTPANILTMIADPESIQTSPFGNVAIVTTADGDAIHVLDDGGTNHAWQIRGLLAYTSGNPMQPGDTTAITRGALNGHVFVSELSSIRQVVFHDDGSVVDTGSLQFGDGLDQILGAIGVQP
jgi:hypothetical protein